MRKNVTLCLALLIVILLMSGCSKVNPFAAPTQSNNYVSNSDKETISKVSKENKEKAMKNKEQAQKNAEETKKNVTKKNKSIYDNAMEKYSKVDDSGEKRDTLEIILSSFYSAYVSIRLSAVWIIVFSVIIGTIGALLSKQNKGARRFFVFSGIIAVPALMIFIVFGVGILNNLFLYN